MRRAQYAAELPFALQAASDVEEVGLHTLRAGFVEAGFDQPCGARQGMEITALVPAARGGPGDRGDDGHGGVRPYGSADISHQRCDDRAAEVQIRSEEHTSELQSRPHLVCRLLLEKK